MTAWPNTFTLGGVLLDQDTAGSFRVVRSATGWDDAAVRNELQSRAQQDGSWDSTGWFDARQVSIEGFVSEASPQDAQSVKDKLAALWPQSLWGLSVANAQIGTRYASVRVTAGVVVEWIDAATFTYTIQVTAPDPLKYGAQVFGAASLRATSGTGLVYPRAYPLDYGVAAGQTPGSIAVANSGTAAYWPRLRIDGPAPNPVVTLNETGDWLRYGGTITTGQWLDVDLANRRVLLNGQVSARRLVTTSGNWLAVPVGGGSVSWAADGADPAAKLSVWSYEGAWS